MKTLKLEVTILHLPPVRGTEGIHVGASQGRRVVQNMIILLGYR